MAVLWRGKQTMRVTCVGIGGIACAAAAITPKKTETGCRLVLVR